MSFVLKAENISKAYQLGTMGTGTLSRDIERWISRIRGKEDLFLKIGETNDRTVKGQSNIVWSLKDVCFEIEQGEAVGIIGDNGAGKSTILKIMSRVTSPTTGRIIGYGRVASLLEVGTGFHPELTGRENIYLNGAILGMRKKEIERHFEEIVDFSGVERYIDTPVKRYSSGMYVRLAFAVAAHLEPDIMIIDEVLAVGDAEFQKKCLGKMNQVSSEQGRTILFVSHNMQAVIKLCSKVIWLDKGKVRAIGTPKNIVNQYLGAFQNKIWKQEFKTLHEAPGNEFIRILCVELVPDLPDPSAPLDIRTPLTIKFKFYNSSKNGKLNTSLWLFTLSGDCVFDISSSPSFYDEGIIEGACSIPGNFLNDGSYYFSLYFAKDTSYPLFTYEACLSFDIADFREDMNWYDKWWGYVRPNFPLVLNPLSITINQ